VSLARLAHHLQDHLPHEPTEHDAPDARTPPSPPPRRPSPLPPQLALDSCQHMERRDAPHHAAERDAQDEHVAGERPGRFPGSGAPTRRRGRGWCDATRTARLPARLGPALRSPLPLADRSSRDASPLGHRHAGFASAAEAQRTSLRSQAATRLRSEGGQGFLLRLESREWRVHSIHDGADPLAPRHDPHMSTSP